MGRHPNKAFLSDPRRLIGRTSSQQLSPPSSFAVNLGSGGRDSIRSCLILMSLNSICKGNLIPAPNTLLYRRRQLSLLRQWLSLPEGDRSHATKPLVRPEDSDLNRTRVSLSDRRVMTLPQKTMSSGTSLETEAVAGNSNSERSIMETVIS
ncbi:hypothetical protein V8G54_026828 [Vigna mungo]|uniref:Uncharacterized protein n=1 Tax=Vigna mungo TaxID=3915 RepID=A0AAQ3RMH7_VIGMU